MSRDDAASYAADWWTPEPWLDWVAATLGPDYYDPCPADWDGALSGLSHPWQHRETSVYVNHPGGGLMDRGAKQRWWDKTLPCDRKIWCAFSIEQLRLLRPRPLSLEGWLITPDRRLPFIWGGPSGVYDKGVCRPGKPGDKGYREHGEPMKSPATWAVFWSSVEPAPTPEPCIVIRTGVTS